MKIKTIFCIVCHKEIGIFGWPSHVKKEKKLHGYDIYKRIKAGGSIKGPLDPFLEEEE